jgi:predicted nucleotidyltransferase
VSFEGLYGGAADAGDRILVTGHLEQERGGGRRLVVGSGFLPDGGTLRVAGPGAA